MVIVARADLNMRKGKLGSQIGHAVQKVFFDRMKYEYERCDNDIYSQVFRTYFTKEMLKWLTWKEGQEGFTKIVLGCDSEEELLKIKRLADEAMIPNAIILDNGVTEFHGVKTYTCIALGPDDVEKIDKITGGYKLL